MSSHERCRSRHTIKAVSHEAVLLCDTAFHQAAANNAPRRLSSTLPPPSALVGVVKPVCLPPTQHGTPTTTLRAARARTACLEARELYHASALFCPVHDVSGTTPQRLTAQRKRGCCPGAASQILRGPCYACITRGIRARIAKMRDRKPPRNDRHQSISHSSRAYSPCLGPRSQRPSSVPTLPSSQRLPASRGFTNHSPRPLHHHHWAGSLASIHRPERAGAGRGSTINLLCASVPGIQQASSAMQYAMQYAAGRHCLPRQQSALLPQCIA